MTSASRSRCGSTAASTRSSAPSPSRVGPEIPYWLEGSADVAETTYVPFTSRRRKQAFRLIHPAGDAHPREPAGAPGHRLHLSRPHHRSHGHQPVELEADHRRHAEIENTIRDVKYGMALNHMPSGRFAANAAWVGFNVIAHNLARWVTRLGSEGDPAHHQDRPHSILRPARQAGSDGAAPSPPSAGKLAVARGLPGRAREPGLTHHPDPPRPRNRCCAPHRWFPGFRSPRDADHRVIRLDQPSPKPDPPRPHLQSGLADSEYLASERRPAPHSVDPAYATASGAADAVRPVAPAPAWYRPMPGRWVRSRFSS